MIKQINNQNRGKYLHVRTHANLTHLHPSVRTIPIGSRGKVIGSGFREAFKQGMTDPNRKAVLVEFDGRSRENRVRMCFMDQLTILGRAD